MPTEILMPALSPTMETGKLAKWLVKEGDTVTSGDIIAEIETDKATMEVEAVDEGKVGKILIAEGTEDVAVNTTIAVLLEDGESADDITVSAAPAATAPAPAAPAPVEAASADAVATPAAAPAPAATPARQPDARIFASPLARRIAKQNNIDIALLSGSGPHGRIIKLDVETALKDGVPPAASAAAAPAAAPAMASGPSDDMVRRLFAEGSFEELPHDGMRKTIASRLTESHQTIPAYFISVDCTLDALLKSRAEFNAVAPKDKDDKPAYKLSVNDFIIKALALALRDVPTANASWTSTARLLHKHSDVGVAVAIPDGLITPIVREAEIKPLSMISAEVKDMARRARDRKLKPEEYLGGTTAVSNLGMFGIDNFTSVINPPHASIVSIGAGVQKPVVKDGAVAIATVMSATFAFDHRVIDGALGGQLATAFRHYLENPMAMLV